MKATGLLTLMNQLILNALFTKFFFSHHGPVHSSSLDWSANGIPTRKWLPDSTPCSIIEVSVIDTHGSTYLFKPTAELSMWLFD